MIVAYWGYSAAVNSAVACRRLKPTQMTMAYYSWKHRRKLPATWTNCSWR